MYKKVKYLIIAIFFFGSCSLFFTLSSCAEHAEKEIQKNSVPTTTDLPIDAKYQVYCGSCHLTPNPTNIPEVIWEKNVLPDMAARLGHKYQHYNPYYKNSMEENLLIRTENIYPNNSTIDTLSWRQIHDYIINLAPDAIPVDTLRNHRNFPLDQFKPREISLGENDNGGMVNIQFEVQSNQFLIGDANGQVYKWPIPVDSKLQFNSPVISYNVMGNDQFYTEIGFMNPSEIPNGLIHRKRFQKSDTLLNNLHRPVYTEIVDLNEDGKYEIVICEFGNFSGELSMLTQSEDSFEKRTMLPVPGTIKLEIKDMDKDGKKDIVVLASQGNEGIYILYQTGDLQFNTERVIRMGPEYGSSWFETLDYDRDGDLDIVLANGDNADNTNFPKPYHGIRLFMNDGNNAFAEQWFYPIYGATKVLAEDFDSDGDFDFAVIAYFADYVNIPDESFVYLENQDTDNYVFKPHTYAQPSSAQWLVMDKGDVDNDGDVDLLLGSFVIPSAKDYKDQLNTYRDQKINFLFLENQQKTNKIYNPL